jgi:hypothetical protein
MQNLENFGHQEGHRFDFQNLGEWKSLKLWNEAGPTCQSQQPLNRSHPVTGRPRARPRDTADGDRASLVTTGRVRRPSPYPLRDIVEEAKSTCFSSPSQRCFFLRCGSKCQAATDSAPSTAPRAVLLNGRRAPHHGQAYSIHLRPRRCILGLPPHRAHLVGISNRADSCLMEPSPVTSSTDHSPSCGHRCGESFPSLPPQLSHILRQLALAASPAHLVAGLSGIERRRHRPVAMSCASPVLLSGWQPSPCWAGQKRPKCTVDLHNFQLN